jgi:hypothetical protein
MLEGRSPVLARKKGRSAMTNGTILPGVDGRSTWARRLRDLVTLHVADLGGDENVSEAERAIIRRAATLICELERMEAGFAVADGADDAALEVYQRAANSMRRLLEAVGLQRRARDVTPTLGQYLTARATAAGNGGPAGESNASGPSPASADAENHTSEANSGNLDGAE